MRREAPRAPSVSQGSHPSWRSCLQGPGPQLAPLSGQTPGWSLPISAITETSRLQVSGGESICLQKADSPIWREKVGVLGTTCVLFFNSHCAMIPISQVRKQSRRCLMCRSSLSQPAAGLGSELTYLPPCCSSGDGGLWGVSWLRVLAIVLPVSFDLSQHTCSHTRSSITQMPSHASIHVTCTPIHTPMWSHTLCTHTCVHTLPQAYALFCSPLSLGTNVSSHPQR